tara:strand:+ start:82 stop:639 length:558 start_codon:yes stop_codon:yes gene_type:complete
MKARKFKRDGKGGSFNILESEIRHAMDNTLSNRSAARFLGIDYRTYKKYSEMYYDSDGRNLFEVHKNQKGLGLKHKSRKGYKSRYPIQEVIEGKHPDHPPAKLKQRLFVEAYKAEECESCGFDERRMTDYTVPLMLDWIDGDKTNHKLDNLRVLCLNCYYLQVGNPCNSRAGKRDFKENGGYLEK